MNSKSKQLKLVETTTAPQMGNSPDPVRDNIKSFLQEASETLFETRRPRAAATQLPTTPREQLEMLRMAESQPDVMGSYLEIEAALLARDYRNRTEIAPTVFDQGGYNYRNPYNLLENLPNTDKRIHIVEIHDVVQRLVKGIGYYYGQLWTPSSFVSTHDGHRLVWALIEDYVNQQCIWNVEFNDRCEVLIGITPRFSQVLAEFKPPRNINLPNREGSLQLDSIEDAFNCNILDPVRESIHAKVSELVKGPTFMIWGVIQVPTMMGGRQAGYVPVLMSGVDFRIVDYDRRMGTGEWRL